MAVTEARGFRRLLGSVWFALVLALIAMGITSLCLTTGFTTDDFFFLASFKGFPGLPEYHQNPLNTFVFSDGNPERNAALMDRGVSPWWSVSEGRLAFFRPLASCSHWLDYRIFGENPWPMHLESMLWYALLCVALFLLYRRLMTPVWLAGLAAFLFAIDSDNGMNVGWISSRNTLMSACFIVFVLLAHHHWRSRKSVAAAVCAPILLIVGFLCGEAAMGALAYLFAYALFLDNSKWPQRFASLVPCGTVFAVWMILYRVMGYGTVGSAWYVDPGSNPAAFFDRLLVHLPALLTNQLIGEPNSVARVLGGTSPFTQFLGLTALALIFLALLPLLRRSPVARFSALGMLLAMLPVCTVVSQPRLVLIPGIGGMVLISMFLHGVFSRAEWASNRRWLRPAFMALACAWVVLHGIIPAYFMPFMSRAWGGYGQKLELAFSDLPNSETDMLKTVTILQAPNDFLSWYFHIMRSSMRQAIPAHTRSLCTGEKGITITRPDANTLVLHAEKGLIRSKQTSIYRGAGYPMHVGDAVAMTGMTATVRAVDGNGWPTEAEFRFALPLENPSYKWYCATRLPYFPRSVLTTARFVPVPLPAIGETATVEVLLDRSPEYQALKQSLPAREK